MSLENILRKIAALRAKTEEAGATEYEALAAAEKASQLMAEYEIEEADLAARGEREKASVGRKFSDASNRTQFHPVFSVDTMIGRFTGTKAVGDKSSGSPKVAFIGERPDVELAVFLHDTIKRAIDAEWARYLKIVGRHRGKGAKRSFELGMTSRLNSRLSELIAEREAVRDQDCRALVVSKRQVVDAAVREFYPRLKRRSSGGRRINNGDAYSAGREAGSRVGLGRPIGGGSSSGPVMIGN